MIFGMLQISRRVKNAGLDNKTSKQMLAELKVSKETTDFLADTVSVLGLERNCFQGLPYTGYVCVLTRREPVSLVPPIPWLWGIHSTLSHPSAGDDCNEKESGGNCSSDLTIHQSIKHMVLMLIQIFPSSLWTLRRKTPAKKGSWWLNGLKLKTEQNKQTIDS